MKAILILLAIIAPPFLIILSVVFTLAVIITVLIDRFFRTDWSDKVICIIGCSEVKY